MNIQAWRYVHFVHTVVGACIRLPQHPPNGVLEANLYIYIRFNKITHIIHTCMHTNNKNFNEYFRSQLLLSDTIQFDFSLQLWQIYKVSIQKIYKSYIRIIKRAPINYECIMKQIIFKSISDLFLKTGNKLYQNQVQISS